MSSLDPESLLRKHAVVVPFAYLNPKVKEMIGEKFTLWGISNIRSLRRYRSFMEVALPYSAVTGGFPTLVAVAARQMSVGGIQTLHTQIADSMRQHGVIMSAHEGHFPKDWINPAVVSNTHPIFYVKRNGDVVFVRETRREYFQYRRQQESLGVWGLNPWRWRTYLRKPKAPKSVVKWATEQLRKTMPVMRSRVPIPHSAIRSRLRSASRRVRLK